MKPTIRILIANSCYCSFFSRRRNDRHYRLEHFFFFFFFCKKVKLEKKDRSFFYGYSKRDLDRVFKVLKCKSCCTYSSFSAFYIVSSVGCTRVHLASLIYLLSVFSFVYFILCNLYRGKLYRVQIIRQLCVSFFL